MSNAMDRPLRNRRASGRALRVAHSHRTASGRDQRTLREDAKNSRVLAARPDPRPGLAIPPLVVPVAARLVATIERFEQTRKTKRIERDRRTAWLHTKNSLQDEDRLLSLRTSQRLASPTLRCSLLLSVASVMSPSFRHAKAYRSRRLPSVISSAIWGSSLPSWTWGVCSKPNQGYARRVSVE